MSSFKDQIAQDISAFINADEFAGDHVIDGRVLTVIVVEDSSDNIYRNKHPLAYAEGVSLVRKVLYISEVELGYIPIQDQYMTLDGRRYQVTMVGDEEGVLVITLEANVS